MGFAVRIWSSRRVSGFDGLASGACEAALVVFEA